ncbi:hypothetical protein V1260_03450 [Brachybacterium sp. J144]|uniref:hypothetical protein n=1 Tax=Brachybacterium sp. J144 TaxID=3116487 RepID=UPI002E7A1234|nr:hypothetical protein [Brachybacterium sp. J144]MEE1649835.1 hypothetical protein [Brachybacterium sp. J144]
MTRLEVLGELQTDPNGPLAKRGRGGEDLWSLLVAYGRMLWPPEGRAGWFSGLDAQLRDASRTDGPLAIIETTAPAEDALLTSLVLSVAQVLRACGRAEITGLRVSTEITDTGPSWQPRSWIANLAHRTDSAEGIRVSLHCPSSTGADVLPTTGHFGDGIRELLFLGGRDYPRSTEATSSGVGLLVEEMRWTELHGAYLIDLSVLAIHAAGFRGEVTISAQPPD